MEKLHGTCMRPIHGCPAPESQWLFREMRHDGEVRRRPRRRPRCRSPMDLHQMIGRGFSTVQIQNRSMWCAACVCVAPLAAADLTLADWKALDQALLHGIRISGTMSEAKVAWGSPYASARSLAKAQYAFDATIESMSHWTWTMGLERNSSRYGVESGSDPLLIATSEAWHRSPHLYAQRRFMSATHPEWAEWGEGSSSLFIFDPTRQSPEENPCVRSWFALGRGLSRICTNLELGARRSDHLRTASASAVIRGREIGLSLTFDVDSQWRVVHCAGHNRSNGAIEFMIRNNGPHRSQDEKDASNPFAQWGTYADSVRRIDIGLTACRPLPQESTEHITGVFAPPFGSMVEVTDMTSRPERTYTATGTSQKMIEEVALNPDRIEAGNILGRQDDWKNDDAGSSSNDNRSNHAASAPSTQKHSWTPILVIAGAALLIGGAALLILGGTRGKER